MAKLKLSGFKSTGDRVPRRGLRNISATTNRITRTNSKRPRIASDDDSSDLSDAPDTDVYSPERESENTLSLPPESGIATMSIQTRSGQKPQALEPAKKEEVSRFHI
jgi:hypothetical protein